MLSQNGFAGETPLGIQALYCRLLKQIEQKCKYLSRPPCSSPVSPGRQNKIPETRRKRVQAARNCLILAWFPRPAVAGQLHWPTSPLWSEDPFIPLLGDPLGEPDRALPQLLVLVD